MIAKHLHLGEPIRIGDFNGIYSRYVPKFSEKVSCSGFKKYLPFLLEKHDDMFEFQVTVYSGLKKNCMPLPPLKQFCMHRRYSAVVCLLLCAYHANILLNLCCGFYVWMKHLIKKVQQNHNYMCHIICKIIFRFKLSLNSYWQNITFHKMDPNLTYSKNHNL